MAKKVKKSKKVVKKAAKKMMAPSKKQCVAGPLKVSKPFNKSQISGAIADMVCVSKKDANCMIDAMFESPTDGIKNLKISKAYAASKIEQGHAQRLKAS